MFIKEENYMAQQATGTGGDSYTCETAGGIESTPPPKYPNIDVDHATPDMMNRLENGNHEIALKLLSSRKGFIDISKHYLQQNQHQQANKYHSHSLEKFAATKTYQRVRSPVESNETIENAEEMIQNEAKLRNSNNATAVVVDEAIPNRLMVQPTPQEQYPKTVSLIV